MLSLTGCLHKTEPYELTSDRIVYVSYSCASVTDGESFSFTIYETEDGVKFTAWCPSGWDDIVISGASVTTEDMDRLRGIAEEYDISGFMWACEPRELTEFTYNETLYDFRVMWDNGEERETDTAWLASDAVREFFFDLAERTYRGE